MIIDRYMIKHREGLNLQNLMNPMFGDPQPFDKQKFWRLIDRWKAYLVNEYGLRKGQVVGWGCAKNSVETHAIMFAIAELGAQVFPAHLAWHPDAETDTISTVINPEFGFWDNVTLNMLGGVQDSFYGKYLEFEMINIDQVDINNYDEPMDYQVPDILPDDPFYITYSDGRCEDGYELQYYTHREAWGLAHRQFKLLNMNNSVGVHTFNLLHCMSFVTYTLAAYMGCQQHFVLNWWDRIDQWKPPMLKMLERVYDTGGHKVIFFKNEETLRLTMPYLKDECKADIDFVLPMGEPTESLQELVDEFGIRTFVFYGENKVKAPLLFIKPVLPNRGHTGGIGFLADNYYECVFTKQKGVMFVRGHHDTGYRQLSKTLDKNEETGEYAITGDVDVHPYQKRVEEMLGHDDFFLLRKLGRNYLAVFEEPSAKEYALLDTLGLTHIAVIDRMAYCLENKRYREWFALKNQFWYGFDSYEEGRVRYYNGEG